MLMASLSGRLAKGEVHMNRIIGKDHAPTVGTIKHGCDQQSLHVAIFHVAINAAGNLSDGHFALPCHGLQNIPPLGGEDLPQQFDSGKADEFATLSPRKAAAI
jgi:hypothetical protein